MEQPVYYCTLCGASSTQKSEQCISKGCIGKMEEK